ncbi:MAG: DUF4142 domain-containing protein [Rhodospirillales bacterium]|nr:DUF4142 domain-containing protein [Rhodospirillales bacterium]
MAKQYDDVVKDLEQAAQASGINATRGEALLGENRLRRLQIGGDDFDLAYTIGQQGLHDKLIAVYTTEAKAKKDDALTEHAKKGREILSETATGSIRSKRVCVKHATVPVASRPCRRP